MARAQSEGRDGSDGSEGSPARESRDRGTLKRATIPPLTRRATSGPYCQPKIARSRRRSRPPRRLPVAGFTPTATTPELLPYGVSTRSTWPRGRNSSCTATAMRLSMSSCPGCVGVIVERTVRVVRMDARRFDGELALILVENDDVEQHVQHWPILAVAARRTQREKLISVFAHDFAKALRRLCVLRRIAEENSVSGG